MSLDVMLYGPEAETECECQCGHKHTKKVRECLYDANITHNLNTMAGEAGIYEQLWRPDEIGVTKASQLIEPLKVGLELLESDKKRFEAFNPENGWGSYEGLVRYVREYLEACREYPDANVEVSR